MVGLFTVEHAEVRQIGMVKEDIALRGFFVYGSGDGEVEASLEDMALMQGPGGRHGAVEPVDMGADDIVAMGDQRFYGEIVEHAAIHPFAAPVNDGFEDHGHAGGGQQGFDDRAGGDDLCPSRGEVGSGDKEPDGQVFKIPAGQVLFQGGSHAVHVKEARVAEEQVGDAEIGRVMEDVFYLFRRQAGCIEGGDEGSRAGPGYRGGTNSPFFEGAEDPQVSNGAGPAAGKCYAYMLHVLFLVKVS